MLAGHVTMAGGDAVSVGDGEGVAAAVGLSILGVGEMMDDGEVDGETPLDAWDTGLETVPQAASRNTTPTSAPLTEM